MPTKTERILGYLPHTFQAAPRPTALYSVVDAFGYELLKAENSLAAVMLAHWVDKADQGADLTRDLACLAALYGLTPRGAQAITALPGKGRICPPLVSDETVEGFRGHLKRYVRMLLEGTVTVQGILRVVAESLGLEIADDFAQLDAWWTRRGEALTCVEARGDDAAATLFGVTAAQVEGTADRPAQVVGRVDFAGGIDLRAASFLRLTVDGGPLVEVDLAAHAADPARVKPGEVEVAVNNALSASVAKSDGRILTLTSPTAGSGSRLDVLDGAGDAAPIVLGVSPRVYRGSDPVAARVRGTVDLGGGVDLADVRYLRVAIDGRLAEVDCAGTMPAVTQLDEVVAALEKALGSGAASHDGRVLTLTSPTPGLSGSIEFQPSAGQDAHERLLGQVPTLTRGADARPAIAVGRRDLAAGVDLHGPSKIQVRLDGGPPLIADCAGADPTHTTLGEIVSALNAALGQPLASHDGHLVRLATPTAGSARVLAFDVLPDDEDATELIFGIGSRTFRGAVRKRAVFEGKPDLSRGADLRALTSIALALDGGPPVEVNIAASAADASSVTLDEMTARMNAGLGPGVASHDGRHLRIASPIEGTASRISIDPLLVTNLRRFATRAFFRGEAAEKLFGFFSGHADGGPAAPARVTGTADLSRGVDLRPAPFLRIGVDGGTPLDVDCSAGVPRPRAAMPHEIVAAINRALGNLASLAGNHLRLTSPTAGASSELRFEAPRADLLLGLPPGSYMGTAPSAVRFVGTVDLSGGIDLTPGDLIQVGFDGAAPVSIHCAGPDRAHTTLTQIKNAINMTVPGVATDDGKHPILTSRKSGPAGQIHFGSPVAADATSAIFGIKPPRQYRGAPAENARVVSALDLPAAVDLRVAPLLQVGAGGHAPVVVNLTSGVPDAAHATPAQIRDAINAAVAQLVPPLPVIASLMGSRLVLSTTAGVSGDRLEVGSLTSPDARSIVLGTVREVASGSDPSPAVITGKVDLLAPVDLGDRRRLRLSVDGGVPVDIDVAGAVPEQTALNEVISRINDQFPGLAAVTSHDRLQLKSPIAGNGSSLDVLPVRILELIEYPPECRRDGPFEVRHGEAWQLFNDGAAEGDLALHIDAPHGAIGPELVNSAAGVRVRLMVTVPTGGSARIMRDAVSGLRAEIVAADGSMHTLAGSQILAGPIGVQAWVSDGEAQLSGGKPDSPATVQLSNPSASAVVVLRALEPGPQGNRIRVQVREATLATDGAASIPDGTRTRLVGRLVQDPEGYQLVDAKGATVGRLRPGPAVSLQDHLAQVVAVRGPVYGADQRLPLMVVERVARLFDVTVSDPSAPGGPVREEYPGVTLGEGEDEADSLTLQLTTTPSKRLRGAEFDKGAVLRLPRGPSGWRYLDCSGARFDVSEFDHARFIGGRCLDAGIFDVSLFAPTVPEHEVAVFAATGAPAPPAVSITACWTRFQPGVFGVTLPVDLPEEFGGRFNLSRFARSAGRPEEYQGVVTEPAPDPKNLVAEVNATSTLISAEALPAGTGPPPGWTALTIPLPGRHTLSGGGAASKAQLFLREAQDTVVIKLQARDPGAWGNDIGLTVRKAGPARFNVMVDYEGARFESACQVALGMPSSTLAGELLRPGQLTILRAKAAGIRAECTRDRTQRLS